MSLLPLWDECRWSSLLSRRRSPSLSSQTQTHTHTLTGGLAAFPVDEELNDKIYLYLGSACKLPCDALVVGQNETLSDRRGDNELIVTVAGPQTEREMAEAAPVQTGQCAHTAGGALPCTHLIHAVGPRYDERYAHAADYALHSAYRQALSLCVELGARDVVLTCVYLPRKGYPRWEAAQCVLRTVRKFLQQRRQHSSTSLHRLMFCVSTQDDFEIYDTLLTAFFPRTEEEVRYQVNLLPEDLGDVWGEVRREGAEELIVSAGPQPLSAEALREYCEGREERETEQGEQEFERPRHSYEAYSHRTGMKNDILANVPRTTQTRSMSDMVHDEDEFRRRKVAFELENMTRGERLRLKYSAMVSHMEDFEDLSEVPPFLFFAGTDVRGRDVLAVDVPLLRGLDEEIVAQRAASLLEKKYRSRPFVLLVFCPMGTTLDHRPLQTLFEYLTARYKENIQKIYLYNPSVWFRMFVLSSMPYLTSDFWSVYAVVSSRNELEHFMNVEELHLPERIFEKIDEE